MKRGVILDVVAKIDRVDRAIGLGPLLVHDDQRRNGVEQDRIDVLGHDIDRMRINRFDFGDAPDVAAHVGAFALSSLERKHDIVGFESISVVELHALAQAEAPGGRIDDFPANGQRRFDLQISIVANQGLVDVAVESDREVLGQRVGVHRGDIALERKSEGFGLSGNRGRHAGRQRQRTG